MSFLPSNDAIRKQLHTEKVRGNKPDWDLFTKGMCPLCGEKLREDARWKFCYRPTVHEIFRAKKQKPVEKEVRRTNAQAEKLLGKIFAGARQKRKADKWNHRE